MEDPWANAWGDSTKSIFPEPSPLWAAPSVSVLHGDNEDDLSTPTWPKDSGSGWSAADLPADHIWNTPDVSSTWTPHPSTFDEISLTGGYTPKETPQPEIQEADGFSSSSISLHDEEAWPHPKAQLEEVQPPTSPVSFPSETLETTNPAHVGSASQDEQSCSPSRSSPSPNLPLHKSTPAPLSEDSDAFGSFETGLDDQDKESWTPTNSTLPPVSAAGSANWDSAWKDDSEDEKHEQEDAWEAARREKEKQDRHVARHSSPFFRPPELLSSILRQLEELSNDIWEDLGTSEAEINDKLDFEMLGLHSVLQRLSPDGMTLPPTVPYAKTFTMKHMSDSLKLTRHYPSTRLSPMAMYLASKGSNSWEAAVKARPILPSDDDTPLGWKTVDSSGQEETPVEEGKKKVGGIFSFFGRRNPNLSLEGSSRRSISPITTSGLTPSRTSTSRTGSPATVEPSNTERSKSTVSEPSIVVSTPDNKSTSTLPTIDAARDEIQPESAQPSAVSRFLGRIAGRPKPRSNDSLALSADDLEFLADVPTTSNGNGLKDDDLRMILETPPPPAMPPPPLAPPPRLRPPPSRSTRPGGGEDLLSLFDNTPNPTPPENTSTMNLLSSLAMSSGNLATSQSTSSHAPSPEPMWTAFEEQAVKSIPSRYPGVDSVDLLNSSSSLPPIKSLIPALPPPDYRPTINGSTKKSHGPQIPSFSVSTSIPILARPTSPPLKPIQIDDDDDFADFLSSPPVQNAQFNLFSLERSATASTSIPSIKTTDTHDDFGDFGEVIDNFSAPPTTNAPPITASTQSKTAVQTRKVSKKVDHSRTLSLLETGAARGRWLAPPSPIPEALSPPPASGTASVGPVSRKLDMQTQQALAMAASPAASRSDMTTAWHLPPPPSGTLLTPSVIPSSAPVHPRLTLPSRPVQPSRPPSSARVGGLSAQDLSFFEGL